MVARFAEPDVDSHLPKILNLVISPLLCYKVFLLKFLFYKKATKIKKIFTVFLQYVVRFKSTVKISSIFVAFLENMNFKSLCIIDTKSGLNVVITLLLLWQEVVPPKTNTRFV